MRGCHGSARAPVARLVLLVVAIGLAGCGDDAADQPSQVRTASNGDVFNSADVQFAVAMIPHHAQAIEMVSMTDGRSLDAEVQQVAQAIREARAPEVETMVDWLTAWGEEVPATSLDHTNAGHHGDAGGAASGPSGPSSTAPGLVPAQDLTALAQAPDDAFESRWLALMIEHHAGAVELVEAERAAGTFPDALALAASIEADHRDRIDELERLLAR